MPRFQLNRRGDLVAADPRPRHLQPGRRFRSTAAWRRARRQQLARQPWCVDCGAVTGLSADHIVPVAEGGAELDEANLQTLCLRCNGRKGAR